MVQVSAQTHLPDTPSVRKNGKNQAHNAGGLSKLFASLLANVREPGGKADSSKTAARIAPSKLSASNQTNGPKAAGGAAPKLQIPVLRTASDRADTRTSPAADPDGKFAGKASQAVQQAPSRKGEPVHPTKQESEEGTSERLSQAKKDRGNRKTQAEEGSPLAGLQLVQSQRTNQNAPVKQNGKDEEAVASVDGKRRDRRKDRIDIEVYDYRTHSGQSTNPDGTAVKSGDAVASKGDGREADLTLTLRSETGAKEGASRASATDSRSFSDALARELREVYNADIVKHASVVLKNGGDGLIRLALKPEALGSVKIHLELADNKIAGHIFVESNEALKAFEREMASLEQAFKDGGFDGASIELALSSDGMGKGSGQGAGPDEKRPFFSGRLAASSYDGALPALDRASLPETAGSPNSYVDLLA